ncbi:Carboxypeptidase A2 [Holothuria leucospilota]|uniref:Carboxypeptidase A2 n=1 Tax=Holothuria leucospilota TaxID=206669 RepID=A0A9Q1BC69_HOLLE|nr:Carboxypeptidase A2 [Holothuria leucospilota]
MFIKFILLFSLVVGSTALKDYSGYKVLRVTPPDSFSHAFLRSLENEFDFWKESKGVGHSADILVSGDRHPILLSKFKKEGCDVTTMIDDVQSLIEDQMKSTSSSSGFNYEEYHTLAEIDAWINDFTAENPTLVQKERILTTYEGRDVYKLKISSNFGEEKPIFFMIGTTHAREWISPATMMNVANFLVSNYIPSRNDNLIDTMEFHIVPVFNKDGYKYTWENDRMWRKTRDPNDGSPCTGTDPNRNWDCQWGTGGSSGRPCSDTYMGTSPASTVEISSMQDHVNVIKDRIKVFMDVHAYSQYWMYPYGYSHTLPADEVELRAASKAAVDAVYAVHDMVYENGPIAEVIYVASGSSADWAYDVAGIKHSYALELRDTGKWGFLLPASQIKPTSEEFFAGCKAIVKYLEDNNQL